MRLSVANVVGFALVAVALGTRGGESGAASPVAQVAETSPAAGPATLAKDVWTIFAAKCLDCHAADLPKPKGKFGYALDLGRIAANPKMVIPGNLEKSELYQMIINNEMPGKKSGLVLTAAEKETIGRWIEAGGLAMLKTPINIAVDTDGTRYIADTGRGEVLIFGADDGFRGTIKDKDLKPTSVAVTADRLFVMDLDGHCIRVYEKTSRKPLGTIPREPRAEQPGHLFMPVNFTLDAHGRIYVSDLSNCQISIYEADGKYVRSFGSRGDLPGQFVRPKGVAVDRAGRTYVVDAASQVCQIFDTSDKLLVYFGEPNGSPAPLTLPAAVLVDDQHLALFQQYAAPDFVLEQLVFISNQFGDRKISVYGLGHHR